MTYGKRATGFSRSPRQGLFQSGPFKKYFWRKANRDRSLDTLQRANAFLAMTARQNEKGRRFGARRAVRMLPPKNFASRESGPSTARVAAGAYGFLTFIQVLDGPRISVYRG